MKWYNIKFNGNEYLFAGIASFVGAVISTVASFAVILSVIA